MDKGAFVIAVKDLVDTYINNPDYKPPRIERRWVSWHFVGYWALSLGIHLSLKHANIEIHLPFGFIKISFKREVETYYDVSIQI